jgi:hypothetical protein
MLSKYCFKACLSSYRSRKTTRRIDSMDAISFADVEKLDVSVGQIVRADASPEARKPACNADDWFRS